MAKIVSYKLGDVKECSFPSLCTHCLFYKDGENRQDLFSLKTEKFARSDSSRINMFKSRTPNGLEVYNSAKRIASTLNYIKDKKVIYTRALMNSQIASAK